MLRTQEFIELLKKGQKMDAIAYSKKYFGAFADSKLSEIQQIMALLVVPLASTKTEKYQVIHQTKSVDYSHLYRRKDGMKS